MDFSYSAAVPITWRMPTFWYVLSMLATLSFDLMQQIYIHLQLRNVGLHFGWWLLYYQVTNNGNQ